jgi:formate dehydrogenase iron-sulfur subunit
MTRVIMVDLARCTHCRACEVACEREHGGRSSMFVQLVDERFSIPINCRHCGDSPCTHVCPTNALQRETDDVVTISPMMCIGCGLCVLACPFGAIWPDAVDKVSRKCDLCLPRLRQGLDPACVLTCSSRALSFGEMESLVDVSLSMPGRTVVSRAAGLTGTIVHFPDGWEFARPEWG